MSGFTVELTGDWDRLKYTLNYLNTNLRQLAVTLNQDQAHRTREAIISNVFNMGGKPYGTGVWWFETGVLMDNLSVKKYGGADSGFLISFGDGKHPHPGKGEAAYNSWIASRLEKSHPLIEPTWNSLKDDFIQEWQALIVKATRGGA